MFNRRFHEVRSGMRVFGRSVSFAEIYTDNKNVRNLRVALRSDSDVIVKGDEVSTRYQKLSNAGMLELYYGLSLIHI